MTSSYLTSVSDLVSKISAQAEKIELVSEMAAATIADGHWVRMFGSGHSVLPIQDAFPRYGGYVGFYPMMDPRLMWTTVSGPGGAEELLWLERQEGYIGNFLKHSEWSSHDMLVVISHGGQNAAPVEVALAAKETGLRVVAITSLQNHTNRPATHSSGKKIGDIADVIIDNCVSPDDATVTVPGVSGKVGGTSTLAAIAIIQSIVTATAQRLAERKYFVRPFASPNAEGIGPKHNDGVYVEFRNRLKNAREE